MARDSTPGAGSRAPAHPAYSARAVEPSTSSAAPIRPGMNARLFPSNWRPLRNEVAFAAAAGFSCVQIVAYDGVLDDARLGEPIEAAAERLAEAALEPVLEVVARVQADGRSAAGLSPLDALRAALPPARRLGCRRMHLHAAPTALFPPTTVAAVEDACERQLSEAVALAADDVRLGFEHNEPRLRLFAEAARCADALEAVPGLGFVWDLNHSSDESAADFLALAPRMSLLHVSDTPLPAVNAHLPLGRGNVDLAWRLREVARRGYAGPAILEIGGHPSSGGFGRDTDDALLDSLRRLRAILPRTGSELAGRTSQPPKPAR
jgi:L-ribulose-5-phosphate 3-epimerase